MTNKEEGFGIPGHYPKRDYMTPEEEARMLSKEAEATPSPGIPLLTASVTTDRKGNMVIKQPKEAKSHSRDGVMKVDAKTASLLGKASHRAQAVSKFQKTDSFGIV